MWYVFICEDKSDTLNLRMTTRPDHIARLNELKDQGRLLIAGPCPAIDSEDPGSAGLREVLSLQTFHH